MKYKPLPHSIRIGIGMVFLVSGIPFAHAATDCNAVTEIPKTQCEALVSLYNATVDPTIGWTDNTGWNNTDTPCSWKGIDCAGTSNVVNIDLSANNLVGTLPSLSAFTELQWLKLNGNQLTGNFPDLTALTKLQVLDLSNNQFSGDLPASISNLTTLQILALNNNGFTGTIPDLKSLVNLKTLQLNNNLLTGNFPNLTSLTQLELLDLSYNQLEGAFPKGLESLAQLKTITVNNNTAQLCVDLTVDYGTLKDKLTTAPNNLNECNKCDGLEGTAKSQCETLFSLYKNTDGLQWSPKPTGWDDPTTICTWGDTIACDADGNVIEINLTNRALKGTLPNLSDLTSLKKLKLGSLGSNPLNGKIPDLSALTALEEIDLSGNQFSDLIPELNALVNLVSLSLNGNKLEGPIPALDKLTLLTTLKLNDNADSLCKDPTRVYGVAATITGFSTIPTCMGIISGTKFNDINDNGVKDVGEPWLDNQTVTAKNTTTNEEVPATTDADGAYTLTVPYGTYTVISNLDTNTQQTTPVRNPPLTTPFGVEISWTKKEQKVDFGVHGKNALTLTKSLTNKDHSITATTTPDNSNLSCDSTECTFYYSSGQTVTLEAIANLVGSNFAEWTGGCATPNGTNNPIDITMDSNKSCGVRFQNFSCSRIKEISPAECTALLSLFDSTSGQFWKQSGGWRDTLTPCTTPWYGVTCDGGKVTAINLSSNDLLGSLPSDFSALSGLQTFDVSGNSELTGALPDSLTNISTLTTLKISGGSVCENLNVDYGLVWGDNLGITTECKPLAPVAAFNILPPKDTLTVDLDAFSDASGVASGFDLDGDYLWTSSCGQTATGQKTSITFPKAVTCDITLTVTDSAKTTITVPKAVVVAPAKLTVKKTGVNSGEATLESKTVNNLTVNLDASLSAKDGDIDSYNWTTSCGPTSTTGPITSITFLQAATCDITLTVKNKAGSSAPVTKTVTVPMASLIVTKTGESSGQVLMNPSNPVTADCFPEICVSQQGNYFPGTTVQLTAKPYPGAIFTGWGGDCDDGSPMGGRLSALLDASVLAQTYPAGTIYDWTTLCSTTTDPTPKSVPTGTGPETSITLSESSTCDITLTVKNAAGTVIGKPFEQKQVKVPVKTPIGGAEAFQILPPRISIVVDEGAKNCTANFDLDPNMEPNLEVQLWDIKTNQQTESAGQVIDNRLTINVGDGYTKAKTYYEPGKRVKLKSIPNHVQKTNSGANTYWEFVRWECLDKNQQPPTILGAQTQKKPLTRFLMPTSYTICKAYFNSDQDIAGQELRKDFNTEGKGALDTGESPSERYPLDKGNNAARQREAMYWAQSAILTVKSFIDPSTPESLERTWLKLVEHGLTDKEFFVLSPEGTVDEDKKWTQSIKIRPANAVIEGSLSTGPVLGHYIEVQVKLLNDEGVEEVLPILVYWGEPPVTLDGDSEVLGGNPPLTSSSVGQTLSNSLGGGVKSRLFRKKGEHGRPCGNVRGG